MHNFPRTFAQFSDSSSGIVAADAGAGSAVAVELSGVGVRVAVGDVSSPAGNNGGGVALGGSRVEVAVRGGEVGVLVRVGSGGEVGRGVLLGAVVSVGIGVQVGGGLSHTDVGDGPGVEVGRGVLLGVGEKREVGVSVSVAARNNGAAVGCAAPPDSPRRLSAITIAATPTAATTIRMMIFAAESELSRVRTCQRPPALPGGSPAGGV